MDRVAYGDLWYVCVGLQENHGNITGLMTHSYLVLSKSVTSLHCGHKAVLYNYTVVQKT